MTIPCDRHPCRCRTVAEFHAAHVNRFGRAWFDPDNRQLTRERWLVKVDPDAQGRAFVVCFARRDGIRWLHGHDRLERAKLDDDVPLGPRMRRRPRRHLCSPQRIAHYLAYHAKDKR